MDVTIVCNKDSKLKKRINLIKDSIPDMQFAFSEPENVNSGDVYIIEEKNNYEESLSVFNLLLNSKIKKRVVILVAGDTVDPVNIVKWMRHGAADYIVKDKITAETITNSIIESAKYILGSLKKVISKDPKRSDYGDRVIVRKGSNWGTLLNNNTYKMSLVMVNIIFHDDAMGRYSEVSRERIHLLVKDELSRIAGNFDGIPWFSSPDSTVLSFHFGDHVNSAALAAIYITGHFFLFCIERLKLNEVLNIRVSVHTGDCLFNKNNTEQITSDLLNSLVHLEFQFTGKNELFITDKVYNELSGRISEYFEKADYFEGSMIYRLKRI